MRKKFLALLLAFVMVAGMLPVSAFAAEGFSDMDGHWSQDAVNRWSEVKVLNGDENGNFNPDKEMTRAEFAQMLCNLMGYTEKAENTFADVPDDAWYADAILKLNAAGVMSGVGGGMAAPNAPITREQAAVLLCRAMNIEPSQSANISFSDAGSVSDWARDAVAALTERGMINGMGDNSFAPALNINRASVATMVNNMVAEYVTEDGATVTGEVNGVVIVKADNVKIEDATLSENIIVAPAAQDATVTLTGATEAAGVVVAAEGAKVVVAETAAAGSVTVEAPKAEAQVAGKAGAIVVAETAEGAKTTVTATAEVTGVTVAAPKTETQLAGKVETVAVAETAEGAKATVAKTAEVKDMTVAAPKAETQVSGKVDTVAVTETASGANITANSGAAIGSVDTKGSDTTITANAGAKVENVTTSGEGVTVNGAKDTITNVTATGGSAEVKASGAEVKNDGADKVTVDGNKDVATGDKTTSNTSGTTGGSTSGGSSGGGTVTPQPPIDPNAPVFTAAKDDETFAGKAMSALQTSISVGTHSNDVYPVTGTLKYITGWAEFNQSLEAEQSGHYVAIAVPKTAGSKDVTGMKLKGHDADGNVVDKVYEGEALTGAFTDNDGAACNVVFRLNDETKAFSIWLKYGEATEYTEYKFSFTGTLEVPEADVVTAPLVDHPTESKPALSDPGTATVAVSSSSLDAAGKPVYNVTITGTDIMNHTNASGTDGRWVGFGMPAKEDGSYTYFVGKGDAEPSAVASIAGRTYEKEGKTYNTVYFSEDTEAGFSTATYKILVKDGDTLVATYNVSFDVTFWKPAGNVLEVRAFSTEEQEQIGEKGTAAGAVTMSVFTLDTVNGKDTYSGTVSGSVDMSKLVHVADEVVNSSGPVGYYTYYALTMASLNDIIAKLHDVNGGPGFDMDVTDEFGAVMATRIFDGDSAVIGSITHNYQLLDKAGRVQYEFDVVITNNCTVAADPATN